MASPIITSLIDEDLYKITQQQAVFHQYPDACARYEFRCRDPEQSVQLGALADELREQIKALGSLRIADGEVDYLKTLGIFRDDYLDFLRSFTLNPSNVFIPERKDGQLELEIEGPWVNTILFEVKLLAIISELYFKEYSTELYEDGEKRLLEKIPTLRELKLLEFGTRRRFSRDWQHNYVFPILAKHMPIKTSNIKIAMDNNIEPVGTMAHEWISAHLGFAPIMEAQRKALYTWLMEYRGKLGVALTDTFTTTAFFQDFDPFLANAYSGIRQDSGDPLEFGNKAIAHYEGMGIDPKTKTLIFSDGLNPHKALQIQQHFEGRINVAFGIGTNLTNDLGPKALNIVIKLTEMEDYLVCKISDTPSKAIGEKYVIEEILEGYGVQA